MVRIFLPFSNNISYAVPRCKLLVITAILHSGRIMQKHRWHLLMNKTRYWHFHFKYLSECCPVFPDN